MLRFLKARLRQRTRTSEFPRGTPEFPDRFRGRPVFEPSRCGDCAACRARMPSDLLQITPAGRPVLDLGACLFSPEEAEACSSGAIRFTTEHAMAAGAREGLRSTTGEFQLAAALERKARALFGRSLRLRSVVAGSCGGCEAELTALGNVVFDMARFGIQFVASPRHADGIVITGAVSTNMRDAVLRTYEATPEPRLVIAVGACAINGGPFRGSPEVGDGVAAELPVDLWVPGCPPHPLTLLDGLLRLLGRLPDPQARRAAAETTPNKR
ncbi:MAG TPA: NADH-quinone oxidoreductase subunit NuoB [Candidatus Saccharimonadaceae bacterium]|jgi:Ni,Fe-hydrogenase III small subunit/formate hydrogenlyase subunit 6/NADH:ubiquinone oxidoreductase subunit I|nr:NADH-quinone oxidoreductase subunit NuoB [Candidatus Saccharimonadaceae bacterium]